MIPAVAGHMEVLPAKVIGASREMTKIGIVKRRIKSNLDFIIISVVIILGNFKGGKHEKLEN
jgi:hypothetical protein